MSGANPISDNPFFTPWDTPFGLPPFERIRPEHFVPAFERAMAEHQAEIETIGRGPWPPSFADTVEALERSGRALDRVNRVFANLEASDSNPQLEAIARDIAPRLAQHQMRVALDRDLFARIADLYERRGELGLAPDQLRLLERHHLRLVRSGAKLDPEGRARIAAINERLASLHTLFGQNVLHDEREWRLVLDAGDLDGLPDFVRAAAAQAAAERDLGGRYVITLARSSIEPFLTFSARRDLRQAAYEAWTARGTHPGAADNRPIIREILALRSEQARLLGYPDFVAYRLDDTMAKNADAVERLLLAVWEPAKAKARAERALIEQQARGEGLNQPIEAWDWRYYAEQVRRARYAIDEAEIKPYFVLDNLVEAAFATAGRLFGLDFAPRPELKAYHPDVRVWEVRDRDGSHVGLFLHDNFARPGKHSGAWSSRYRDQQNLDGWVTPIVVNNNNFAKAEPTLLSFDDAETLFHEFGHALHALLSRARYPSQSGTGCRRRRICAATRAISRPGSRCRKRWSSGCLPRATSTKASPRLNIPPRRCSTSNCTARHRPRPSTPTASSAIFWRATMCRARSGCATARPTSSTCSPAAMPRVITPISGPKCSMPTVLPLLPRRATCSTPSWPGG